MKTFLDLKERASRVKGKWIKRSNNKFYENIKVFANQNVNVDDMLDSGNTMAAYTSDKDMVKIPLDENTSYSVIMHEVNHGLSRWKKTETIKFPSVGTEPSTIEVYMAAFNTLDEMDEKEDLNTTTFNEIVNEYLTQEVMKEVTKEEMNNKPVFKNKECNYTSGVNIMKPFLDKYKKVLIQSQVNRGDMIKVTDYSKHPPVKEIKNGENPLMKFIGKQNYKFLLIYTKVLGLCNYGKFLKAQKGENKKEIAEVADWIKDYKKDPKQALDNLDTNIENMGIFVSFEKFLNDLVANYEKFENNQIKTINPMSIDDVKKDFKNRTQDTSLSN